MEPWAANTVEVVGTATQGCSQVHLCQVQDQDLLIPSQDRVQMRDSQDRDKKKESSVTLYLTVPT